ncbi:ABC transporter ATP-binding protein [Fusibacter tunisiensis]|uniref:ABC-2 type transport system ATP-binding protein n=1 Tax=Fusibacter tunisiensis TaxID=1008308 RepID=A0ABS2MST1_9FIRM|nr:ATP-binding cassette domain-containing protein [Fusibacter tunisiensis]MBM7562479.1 ABC-2 type transport system ATP-binding protein [Fusibacter tunisiensis]
MIEIENLSKAFQVAKRKKGAFSSLFSRDVETVHALNDISFSIDPGEIVGYIGPNGAGKSTTIKIMSGILVPSSGKCEIMGHVPWKSRISHVRNIGVVFGQRTQLWWDVPVLDSFNLLKDIYKVSDSHYARSLDQLVTYLDLSHLLQTPVRQLSLGQRMRCEIAAALIHSPKILFLDEPTIGLDAVSKIAVRQFIQKINAENKVTVVLTTHDMSDIEALANRIILIGKGEKLYDGNLDHLKNTYLKHKRITVDFTAPTTLSEIPGVTTLQTKGQRSVLLVDLNATNIPSVMQALTLRPDILDISVENQPIEEIIVNLYEAHQL